MAAGRWSYGTATYVEAPPFTPATGGILDVAEVRTVASGDPALRGYMYESELPEVNLGTISGFLQSSTAPMAEGVGHNYEVSGDPFTIYGAAADDAGGGDTMTTVKQRAARRLELGEGLNVEAALWAAGGMLPTQAAVVRTGALKAKIAVGVLAEWFAQNNNGMGYFHGGRRAANEIAALQLVNPDEETASLKGGGVLIDGAGYYGKTTIGGVTPTVDQVWLYITGKPMLYRGAVNATVGYGGQNASGSANNRIAGYALRTYVPSIDGPVGVVLVDLTL